MQKLTLGMGLGVLGMSSIFALGVGGGVEPEGRTLEKAVLGTAGNSTPLNVAPRAPLDPGDFAVLGLRCAPVPPELSTHLGLAAGEGVLVNHVAAGSLAAASSLKTFDVIVSVEGQAATLECLQLAIDGGHGLALSVVSGGVLRDLTLDGDPGGEGEFLSVESLAPNHPMRRVGRLQALRSRYAETTQLYEERQRELDEEARQERKSANEEIESLLLASDKRVKTYFDARETELLARLEVEISAALAQPLAELGMDLAVLITPERLAAVERALAELQHALGEDSDGFVKLKYEDQHAERAKQARRKLASVLSEHASSIDQRLGQPFGELHKLLESHGERLGPNHAERVAWTMETIAGIHAQVKERIECAFDRSAEVIHKRLRERLQRMDLPRAGEVEASLEDICGQVEAWSQRFMTLVQADLRLYASALGARPEALGAKLLAEIKRSESALAELQRGTKSALAIQLESTLEIDDTWQSAHGIQALADGLQIQLAGAMLTARRTMGGATSELHATLREERAQSDEAWQDLRKKLGRLLQEAGNNCWELKGPYLDGRLPRKGGEVSMLR